MPDSKEPKKVSFFMQMLRKSIGLPSQQVDVDEQLPPTDAAKKYFEKITAENAPVKLTALQLLSGIKANGYIVDSDNELVVKKLCLYFSGDERMSKYGMNPDKGIALMGGLGVGKTMLMKLLRYNARLPFGFINCSTIADQAEHGGSHDVLRHFTIAKTTSPHLYYGNNTIGFCFNELGREQIPVKYMGNVKNIMELILFNRYENEVPHNMTHFTSNKSPDELKKLYGDYIGDRMREMFNVVIFPENAKSRRK